MKRMTKKLVVILLAVIILLFISVYLFLKLSDAPILHGKISYGLEYKEGLTLDIYYPTNSMTRSSPVLIYLHGGAWVTGRKESVNSTRFNNAFNRLREAGYTIISPEYTLGRPGKSPFPACIYDAFDAVNWIAENADIYNLDISKLGILGESAGAHLALMVGYSDVYDDKLSNLVKIDYLINIYGPVDLNNLYRDRHPVVDKLRSAGDRLPEAVQHVLNLESWLFGFEPDEKPEEAHAFATIYSPVSYLREALPPTLIIHGTDDRLVPVSQSKELKSALDSLSIESELHILDKVDHGFFFASNEQKADVQNWIVEFVKEHTE